MKKRYSYDQAITEYVMLRSQRSEFEADWKEITDYELPGRGLYSLYSQPRKRKLTSDKIVNTTATEAIKVLAAGLQGGLTSPSRPWLRLSWKDEQTNQIEFLKRWLEDSQKRMEYSLQQSNFYPTLHSLYVEYIGFGNAAMYIGEDTDDVPFRFELMTAGEYAFSTNYQGRADKMYRVVFRTPRQMVEQFGNKCSEGVQDMVKNGSANQERVYISVLECVYKHPYRDMPFTQMYWEIGGASTGVGSDTALMATMGTTTEEPLQVNGFNEFPYPVARWDLIGADIYGLGPGAQALPEVKRLQQMEKAFLMATHKDINPPMTAPSYMRGKLKTMPGSRNYVRNPADKVEPMYQRGTFQYQGVSMAIERVENRIKELFFNDIFLTAARDPNLSPLKAAEVHVRDGEKMLRLGPVIERFGNEFVQPAIERCFSIMLRKGLFMEIPPEYAELVGDYKIDIVSPLAQAQKLIASKSIQEVMAFAGQAAQIKPEVMDKFNVDKAVDEYVDAHGAPLSIMNTEEEVQGIRQQRADAQKAAQQKEEGMQAAQMGMQGQQVNADTQKTMAEAGQIMTESLVGQQELGGIQ